jgi:hypothetical protein
VQLSDLIHAVSRIWTPPATNVWTEKQPMTICYWQDMTVCWKRPLVKVQIKAAAQLLKGKLWKKAHGLGERTVLQYLDRESKRHLTLDLDGFMLWLSQNFILTEHQTGITYGGCNRTFAAKLYAAAAEKDSPLEWVKTK